MFDPSDSLNPKEPVFDEAWHAQTLAIADAMVRAGHFSASDWADTLGKELRNAAQAGKADTTETYFNAALCALETLSAKHTGLTEPMQAQRKSQWRRAYENTPHGKPVELSSVKEA